MIRFDEMEEGADVQEFAQCVRLAIEAFKLLENVKARLFPGETMQDLQRHGDTRLIRAPMIETSQVFVYGCDTCQALFRCDRASTFCPMCGRKVTDVELLQPKSLPECGGK
jgi:rubrerythrin